MVKQLVVQVLVCFLVAILGIRHPTALVKLLILNKYLSDIRYQILALELSLVSVFDTVNAVRSYLMERP